MRLPVSSAGAIWKLLRAIDSSGSGEHFIAFGGTSERAPVLRQQFLRGRAEPAAVRLGEPEGAHAYVHVLADEPVDEDVAMLRRARRAAVPVIAVAQAQAGTFSIPYVLATDVVWIRPGEDAPLDAIARAVAARLGESGAPLAARVPLLREPFCEQLLSSVARRNAILAAVAWTSGSDLPGLLLNELRLVLRLAQAYGVEDGLGERLPELAATLGAGFGLRALARELIDLIPGAEWMLRGGVAYGGTRALGEAARLRFARAPRRQPAAVAPAWP